MEMINKYLEGYGNGDAAGPVLNCCCCSFWFDNNQVDNPSTCDHGTHFAHNLEQIVEFHSFRGLQEAHESLELDQWKTNRLIMEDYESRHTEESPLFFDDDAVKIKEKEREGKKREKGQKEERERKGTAACVSVRVWMASEAF